MEYGGRHLTGILLHAKGLIKVAEDLKNDPKWTPEERAQLEKVFKEKLGTADNDINDKIEELKNKFKR